jgi:glyoxylate/hydroxypyruvate reductase A
MTLLLDINGADDSWSPVRWQARFQAELPHVRVARAGSETYTADEVRYAAVWKPTPGLLAQLPNLKAIFNLGAGVDAVLADATLPDVPLVRVVNADLTRRMTEYVTLHVLLHHRRLPMMLAAQREKRWDAKDQWAARAVRVGLMGLGELGRDAADVLLRLGFRVSGWSRNAKTLAGVTTYSGAAGLDAFLGATDILVVLVPLTPATRGMLNRNLFGKLARDGVLGAPVLINAGRGGLQVEADILACLDDGTLGAASLDVFEKEPLPATSALWLHPRVIVTPHNAADSDADEIARAVATQIQWHDRGEPLLHVVDRSLGY